MQSSSRGQGGSVARRTWRMAAATGKSGIPRCKLLTKHTDSGRYTCLCGPFPTDLLRAGSRWPQTPTPHSKRLDDIVFSTSGASLCSHVAVLKIDVENHELEVWRMAPIGRFLGIVCVFYGNGSLSAAATHVLGLQSVTRVGGFGIIEVGILR